MEKYDGGGGAVRPDDPWYDVSASGWGAPAGTEARPEAAEVPPQAVAPGGEDEGAGAAEIYREVRAGAAFQEVRGRYRRFVVPACALFLTWYLAYVVAATTAPALMARPVFGPVNVALLAGLGQFASTFVLTWAYARHARLRRDRLALDLRWETQQLTRGARG
ncbi:DUF485 domain-containing protein [Streptomyces sp. GF20]|uniref:DUF485 domain-containing protein n=1 Tax=unclassified Streptomyces TaxID=2593676 RepID=UPI0013172C6C|nr:MULTISPECIES: DUF485 domain-containing protein [unclassified Streptomyces]MDI3347868.1 DUF485 domain-containing protein [Streptomyces sp. AJ-1]QHC18400.1 DUF485 domain-containing protein [Streptomyces sp. GF20]